MIFIKKINKYPILILIGFTLLEGGTAQAATLIDDFTNVTGGQQSVIRGGTSTQVAISEQPGTTAVPAFPNVIGGHRDLWLQAVSGTNNTLTRTAVGSVASGILSFANGPNVQSWLNVTWDGNDPYTANTGNPNNVGTPTNPGTFANTANDLRRVQRTGLGIQDLTNGGLFNSLAVEVLSADLGIQIQMTVYDRNTTGISTATYNFAQGVNQPTIVYFPFTQAAAALLLPGTPNAVFTGNARFNNVGAINLTLKATRTDVDAQIELLRPANTEETLAKIPEPTVSLLALSMTAVGFATLKKNRTI